MLWALQRPAGQLSNHLQLSSANPSISGKTLAFGVPALNQLISSSASQKAKHVGIQVLVMSPTRELAIQTHETLLALGEPFGITSVAVFGGVDKGGQIRSLRDKKAKIVVGTPGRIMDLVNDGVCDLSRSVKLFASFEFDSDFVAGSPT